MRDIWDLIEASSLGTPDAVAMRERTPPEVARRIVERSHGGPCCDMHNRHCEPPGDLCCWRCTEASHDTFPIPHADGTSCVLAGSTAAERLAELREGARVRAETMPDYPDDPEYLREVIETAEAMWPLAVEAMQRLDERDNERWVICQFDREPHVLDDECQNVKDVTE